MMACVAVFGALFGTADTRAQSQPGFMLREIAPCQMLIAGFNSPPDADHEQPCKQPGLNELVIRKFADQTYGVSLNYSDLSSSWVRAFECSFSGVGVQKGNAILVSIADAAKKSAQGKVCQVQVKQRKASYADASAYEIEIGPDCSAVCSHNESVNKVTIESRKSKAFSPSFDCQKAVTPVEKTVCMNWNLSELDFGVAALWYEGYASGGDIPVAVKTAQTKWLASRNSCGADITCIQKTYEAKFKDLCKALKRPTDKRGLCLV